MKNRYIKHAIAIIFSLFTIAIVDIRAQITIGTTTEPNEDALLDLKENELTGESQKGMLLPRIALIGPNTAFPLERHTKGMIIFNVVSNDSLTIGAYKNDGKKWVPLQIPNGEKEGQFLVIDQESKTPRWVTKYIPPLVPTEDYSLTKSEAFKFTSGAILPANQNPGGNQYNENIPLQSPWQSIMDDIKITPTKADNKIIVFLQTTLMQPHYTAGHTLSYAGGIFLNNQLKGVRMGVITSTGTGLDPVSKAETLFFVLENLPVQENTIQIGFVRRTASNTDVTALHVGKPLTVNAETYPGSTSVSYEFYERN